MSRKKRQQNLREAKDKRMKKVAIGGAVLLVAILAFEVPKMMHSGGSSSSSPAPATTTTAGATATPASTPTSTTAGTAAAAVMPTAASTKLPSDLPPTRAKSQLYSFSHFAGRDPFVQQINAAPTTAGGTGTSSSSGKSSSKPANGTTTAAISHKPTRTLAANGAVRISVNGRIQVVRVGGSFPSANPLFRLVSVSGGVARIGIASGSYTSGAKTVSLAPGRSMTLVDTADGVRYSIRLISAA